MLLNLVYNLVLLMGVSLYVPKWLMEKHGRTRIPSRFGIQLPENNSSSPSIWIHMVSVGEVRAMIPIMRNLQYHKPDFIIHLSTTTHTGLAEAKRVFPEATSHFLLPLDFSFTMEKLVTHLKPDLLILSEGDFWLNMLKQVKKRGGKVVVLNAKMSKRSARNFSLCRSFSRELFGHIDLISAQNQTQIDRFQPHLSEQTEVLCSGNIKLATPQQFLTESEKTTMRKRLHIEESDRVITLGSTHHDEEKILLAKLPELRHRKILVVPRHPQRFDEVRKWIASLKRDDLILIDQMGVLAACYQISDLAIVGGSFIHGVGGHNIFEPVQVGCPVLFGPHMHTQQELTRLVLNAEAGIQTTSNNLVRDVDKLLTETSSYLDRGKALVAENEKILDVTWEALKKYLP